MNRIIILPTGVEDFFHHQYVTWWRCLKFLILLHHPALGVLYFTTVGGIYYMYIHAWTCKVHIGDNRRNLSLNALPLITMSVYDRLFVCCVLLLRCCEQKSQSVDYQWQNIAKYYYYFFKKWWGWWFSNGDHLISGKLGWWNIMILLEWGSDFSPPQKKIIATTGSVTATTTGMESEVKSIMVRKFSLAVQHRLIIQNEA